MNLMEPLQIPAMTRKIVVFNSSLSAAIGRPDTILVAITENGDRYFLNHLFEPEVTKENFHDWLLANGLSRFEILPCQGRLPMFGTYPDALEAHLHVLGAGVVLDEDMRVQQAPNHAGFRPMVALPYDLNEYKFVPKDLGLKALVDQDLYEELRLQPPVMFVNIEYPYDMASACVCQWLTMNGFGVAALAVEVFRRWEHREVLHVIVREPVYFTPFSF